MRVLNSREWPAPPGKIPGLVRIAMLGDSLVFGQGVGPDETLPIALEKQLNEQGAESLFQVINCGVSGYNIWNSLSSLQNLNEFYDAVVLVLCSNDTEMFGRTLSLNYGNEKSRLWEPGTVTSNLMRSALAETLAGLGEKNVPLLVAYYSVWNVPAEVRIAQVLSEFCASLGCPFSNFLDAFAVPRLQQSALVVSRFDAHPSAVAHSTAARYLVQQFRRHGWLDRFRSTRKIASVPSDIFTIASEMAMEGAQHDGVLRWALDTLETKRRTAARSVATGLATGDHRADFRLVSERLKAAYANWRTLSRVNAVAAHLFLSDSGFPVDLWAWEEAVLRAEELLIAARAPDDADAKELLARLPEREIASIVQQLGVFRATILGRAGKASRLGQLLTQVSGGACTLGAPDELRRSTLSSLKELIAIDELLSGQVEIWLKRCAEAENVSFEGVDARGFLALLAKAALSEAAERMARVYKYFDYLFDDGGADTVLLTTVVVHVEVFAHQNREPYMLDVFVDSIAPRRQVIKDGTYIGCDGSTIALTMRFPVFFFGRVKIRVDTPREELRHQRGRILKVEIYNDRERRIVFNRDQLREASGGILEFPYVLVP